MNNIRILLFIYLFYLDFPSVGSIRSILSYCFYEQLVNT